MIATTVVQLLVDAAARAPQCEALVCGNERIDHARCLAAVAGFAHELRALGGQGERVATLIGNSIDGGIAAFACLAAGAQHAPLNALLTPQELEPILADAQPHIFVVQARLAAAALPVARRLGVVHCIVVGDGARHSADAVRGSAPLTPLPDPDAPALLQYTGGTTGRAKGVELTHRALALAVAVAQREVLQPTRERDRVLCMMPLAHSHCAATDWRSVHTCYSGASTLVAATLGRRHALTGAAVLDGYGLPEAGPVLTFNPACGPVKPATVGVPLPGTEIEIVDVETGTLVLPCGESGEIRARGPQLMSGYRNRPDETAQALRDGWLCTGDIGSIDDDGILAIRDRKKDTAIVGDYNIYPREVEEVLLAHPDVADAAVIGVADACRGETLRACVVPCAGAGGDAAALQASLQALCARRLSRYKLPADFSFMAALPNTSAGTADKAALRRGARVRPAIGAAARLVQPRASRAEVVQVDGRCVHRTAMVPRARRRQAPRCAVFRSVPARCAGTGSSQPITASPPPHRGADA